ncbi:MAG TPA: non-canonical purine NTP pyrophosphatase [Candidatus Paceibacterota bacterium]
MRELLLATTNKDKLTEILDGLGEIPFTIITLRDVSADFDIEETASTVEGNALIKAFTYGKRFGKLTLAEDTGLEVDALGGRPGVNTARYAPGTHADRRKKMIEEMSEVTPLRRGARFRSVIAIYDPERGDRVETCEGVCVGRIAESERGEKGWGYDAIFEYEDGKTGGELDWEAKKKHNHRSRAAEAARGMLLRDFR